MLAGQFSLLVACWSKNDGLYLFKTVDTRVVRVEFYDVIGAGAEVAEYVLAKRSSRDQPCHKPLLLELAS